MTNFGSQPIT